jgi:hypothetical protein
MICRSEYGPVIESEGKTVAEVADELQSRLKAIPWDGHDGASLWDAYEYGLVVSSRLLDHSPGSDRHGRDTAWPSDAWRVVCYAVYGDSEGRYLHVDALMPHQVDGPRGEYTELTVMPLFCGKLLEGPDMACLLAGVNAKLLGLI